MVFSRRQVDSAVAVLMESDLVKNWALGVLKAYGVDVNSPAGQKFFRERRRALAERILSTAK